MRLIHVSCAGDRINKVLKEPFLKANTHYTAEADIVRLDNMTLLFPKPDMAST